MKDEGVGRRVQGLRIAAEGLQDAISGFRV